MPDYLFCDWRVRSELTLPELATWQGDDGAPDLVIRLGETPAKLDDAVEVGPFLQIGPDDRSCLLRLAAVADFWVKRPSEVVVAPKAAASDVEVRVFLLNTVLGLVCHLRGQHALNAAAVAVDGRAVALCGPSGMGKSTLAAALQQRGHAVIADELCAVRVDPAGGAAVLATCARLKLWSDALEALGIPCEGLVRNRQGQARFHLPALQPPTTPTPLATVVMLGIAETPQPEQPEHITRPAQRLVALSDAACTPVVAGLLRPPAELLAEQGSIAAATPIWRLRRGAELSSVDACVRMIEALAAA